MKDIGHEFKNHLELVNTLPEPHRFKAWQDVFKVWGFPVPKDYREAADCIVSVLVNRGGFGAAMSGMAMQAVVKAELRD